MKPRFIARCIRNNTYFVRFYITGDCFITALAPTPTCIAHVLCPRVASERT